jgi:hypothetical protein
MKGLSGQRIVTQDGKIALIVEVYFDDKGWQVRYLVVDTGNPMPRREVLVPRACIAAGQRHGDAIRIRLTRAQLEQCLEKDADPPVWYQRDLLRAANYSKAAVSDPHLRSSAIVIGYAAQAQDGRAGRVEPSTRAAGCPEGTCWFRRARWSGSTGRRVSLISA